MRKDKHEDCIFINSFIFMFHKMQMNIQQNWYYIDTFGLLEGEDVRAWLQSSVNNTVLLLIYL